MKLIDESIVPFVKSISLSPTEMLTAMKACQSRGIRGGAIYDYLHSWRQKGKDLAPLHAEPS